MIVMWLCNFVLPEIARANGEEVPVNEGWIQGLCGRLLEHTAIEKLIYVYPQKKSKIIKQGTSGKLEYVGFYQPCNDPSIILDGLSEFFGNLIKNNNVDVIHIMGTEFAHTVSMMDAVESENMVGQTIVSIQGMPSICCQHYLNGIPYSVYKRKRLKDILYGCDLENQQKLMQRRGECETYVLKKARNVFGRTDWDKICTGNINPQRNYYYGGEILRKEFYSGVWSCEKMRKHSICISQATYSIKGFHFFIKALGILKKKYSDIQVKVSGRNVYEGPSWKHNSYEKYICDLLQENGVEDNVSFVGMLTADEMKEMYLSSNVFVSSSTIENSSNSVGEAMLLGMPVVSSNVGGISSMLVHGLEGYLYPVDEPYMLAYYIEQIWEDDFLAKKMGEQARIRALENHNRKKIVEETVSVYKKIRKQ